MKFINLKKTFIIINKDAQAFMIDTFSS